MSTIMSNAPNPQFAREDWVDLTGQWRFAYDDNERGEQEGWWKSELPGGQEIIVPYPPESDLSGIGDYGFHPIVWYQRELDISDNAAVRTLLHFGAVDYDATVWINDTFVGTHQGGSSPFNIDLSTEWLRSLESIRLTVRVFDDPHDLEQPRGKQSWTEQPESIFYKRTTGIWQPVWLESAPEDYITNTRTAFDAEAKQLRVYVEFNQAPGEGTSLELTLETPSGVITTTAETDGRFLQAEMALDGLDDSWLWSPSTPTLLPLRFSLSSGDVVFSYVGLRSLEITQDGYRINGEPVWPRMVLHQGYWPESHLAAPSGDAIKREVELTLALGFNGARTHQKAEDPRYLYWADTLGLLLWGEIGAAYTWSDKAIHRLSNEWTEIVRRDRNHPSVIGWTPFNESWGIGQVASEVQQQEAVRALVALTRSLDGTRPIIGNDGWEHVETDILTIHDYEWSGEELTRRYGSHLTNNEVAAGYNVAEKVLLATEILDADQLPRMITEYGGVSFAPAESEEWYGYGKVQTSEEFVSKYRELTEALHNIETVIGVCYTQLTDTEQETNGLLYADRTPKVEMETLRAITKGSKPG